MWADQITASIAGRRPAFWMPNRAISLRVTRGEGRSVFYQRS